MESEARETRSCSEHENLRLRGSGGSDVDKIVLAETKGELMKNLTW